MKNPFSRLFSRKPMAVLPLPNTDMTEITRRVARTFGAVRVLSSHDGKGFKFQMWFYTEGNTSLFNNHPLIVMSKPYTFQHEAEDAGRAYSAAVREFAAGGMPQITINEDFSSAYCSNRKIG